MVVFFCVGLLLLGFFVVFIFSVFKVFPGVPVCSLWLLSMFSLLTTTHKILTLCSSVTALQAVAEAQYGAIGNGSSWSIRRYANLIDLCISAETCSCFYSKVSCLCSTNRKFQFLLLACNPTMTLDHSRPVFAIETKISGYGNVSQEYLRTKFLTKYGFFR